MGLNDYLGLLAEVDGATSISTISLVDMEVESFSPYIYVDNTWAKHTKTIVRGAPSLGNLWCSKLDFSHPSFAIAVAAALPSPALRRCRSASRPRGQDRPRLPPPQATAASYGHRCSIRSIGDDDPRLKMRYLRVRHRSLNNHSLFILILFQFVIVALVSCHWDLCSRVISFHITYL
jgi:hypothetical protein